MSTKVMMIVGIRNFFQNDFTEWLYCDVILKSYLSKEGCIAYNEHYLCMSHYLFSSDVNLFGAGEF